MDFKVKIGDWVDHEGFGLRGRIIGLFVGRHNQKDVELEYIEANGLVASRWFPEDEITK